jgi:hypothetical protein
VICCFSKPVDNKDPWKGQTSDKVQAVTDYNGKVSAKGTSMNEMTVVSRKAGYYESRETLYNLKFNREKLQWVPYEREVKLVLRKIVNPIPMYAWGMHLMSYPVGTNVWVGYDMLLAEWMPPHGKGVIEDARFHVWSSKGYERGKPSDIMTVRFMGINNGVCGIDDQTVSYQSWLKLPYNARTEGYEEKDFIVKTFIDIEGVARPETNTGTTNCFFRIRSKTDKDGKFIEGLYGKIDGPVEVEGGRGIRVSMFYYVNPTPNDLNMEFDPKKNLIRKKDVSVSVLMP